MERRLGRGELKPYMAQLGNWMPGARLRPGRRELAGFAGVLEWRDRNGRVGYLVEEKRHLANHDVRVVVERLRRRRAGLEPRRRCDKVLLLAPYVRPQQAAVLERARIDYLDLAGNAHLELPGLLVHVEGRRPAREAEPVPARPQKGWIKTVLALLVRPGLVTAPYREVAARADVALGTVAACMKELAARGLLHRTTAERRIVDRPGLVGLWAQAYVEVLRPKLEERRFQLRTRTKREIWRRLETVLTKREVPWALTGADAAYRRKPFFRAEETEIYMPLGELEDRHLLGRLNAQPTRRGGNLLVIAPPGPLAIPRQPRDGLPVAPDLLAYAELNYQRTEQALEAAELLLPRVLDDEAD